MINLKSFIVAHSLDRHSIEEFIISIPESSYVKSGIFGMKSYTTYKIETKLNLPKFDPERLYSVLRRFSDFEVLIARLMAEEKYKGCVLPHLPSKSVLGKNSMDLVDKRKLDLQLFLQILSKHETIKSDPSFLLFLTCEDNAKFEEWKSAVSSSESSKAISSLKKFQFGDTFNYLYSSLKTRIFESSEPEEVRANIDLSEIVHRINKYMPIITHEISLLEGDIRWQQEQANAHSELSTLYEDAEEAEELEITLRKASEYHMRHDFFLRACITSCQNTLNEAKQEQQHLEGILSAIAERKSYIENYVALQEYVKGKPENVETEAQDIIHLKERILKVNENLKKELQNFTKNRDSNLKRILSASCTSAHECGKKRAEFAAGRQKDFPSAKFSAPPAEPSLLSDDDMELI